MNDDILIKVENVGKKFCRSLKKSLLYGVQDVGFDLMGRDRSRAPLRKQEFWANQEISFELRRGECLRLIGRNGAGKTTLLKMLNGLIKPDQGSITMHGRVGALIALGAGFNPILTGRENIYINGSVLGLSKKEIDAKVDEIIDFSEISDFIDSPVQSYSSGMNVRLGFAVATALNPDILLLDEVLAVGDASFRNKCYKRIAELRKNAAVIFVTHQMSHIARMCDTTLVLKSGKTAFLGNVEEGVHHYEKLNESKKNNEVSFLSLNHPFTSFKFNPVADTIDKGNDLIIRFEIESVEAVERFGLRLVLYSSSGDKSLATDTSSINYDILIHPGKNEWTLTFPNLSRS